MSLPRDLSLENVTSSEDSGGVRLLQAFVPELQKLRRNHTHYSSSNSTGHSTIVSGQQVEIVASFDAPGGILALDRPFGLDILIGDAERTAVGVDPLKRLVCVNGTNQGNYQPRCGPFVSRGERQARFHIIVDHSIIEVIANNITAITASVAPSGPRANGVQLYGVHDDDKLSAEVSAWQLTTANINQ